MLAVMARSLFCAIAIAWLVLFVGDFLSTFLYHVPEHVFGQLHLKTHHSTRKTFHHYAVLTPKWSVLLDGTLGAIPYLIIAFLLGTVSVTGAIAGLLFGQFHVWWRHTTILGWRTPQWLTQCCQALWITTPEQHWRHHLKTNVGFGDIFTVFDEPAKAWFRILRWLRLRLRSFPLQS